MGGVLGGGKDLGGTEGRGNTIKIHCVKKGCIIYICTNIYNNNKEKEAINSRGCWARTYGMEKGNIRGVEGKWG